MISQCFYYYEIDVTLNIYLMKIYNIGKKKDFMTIILTH